HPGAITVRSRADRVELTGPILRKDLHRVLSAVRHIHGVKELENRLEVHDGADGVTALQGRAHHIQRRGPFREHWVPAARLLAGGAGAALLSIGLRGDGGWAWPLRVIGGALLARSLVNRSVRTLAA